LLSFFIVRLPSTPTWRTIINRPLDINRRPLALDIDDGWLPHPRLALFPEVFVPSILIGADCRPYPLAEIARTSAGGQKRQR
jgi:hypothetical protein